VNHGHYSRKVYWLVFAVGFAGFMGATLFYTSKQQRLYESAAKVQFLPRFYENEVRDFTERISFIESPALAQRVAKRLLKPSDPHPLSLEAFLKPYGHHADAGLAVIVDLLWANRTVVAHPESNTAEVQYRHPDRLVAARIANMFADEYIAAESNRRIDEQMKEVEALKVKADRQEEKMKALQQAMTTYRTAHPDLSPEALQADETYQALSKQLAAEEQVLKKIITRMSAMSIS
jgi:uncharacterized protein involved in exopolysaccharide biosynthesis